MNNLEQILTTMEPVLDPTTYVFCRTTKSLVEVAPLGPLVTVQEGPDLTVVLPRDAAVTAALEFSGEFSYINMGADTSLEAVGFTAVFSTALAEQGISANVVAGFHRDHLFVQHGLGAKAMAVLAACKANAMASATASAGPNSRDNN